MRYLGLAFALGSFLAAQDQSVPPPAKPDKDAAWKKVIELKSGTELRIFKVKQPTQAVLAKLDEGDSERLVVVIGNSQTAIPRDEIDRIDYRPTSGTGGGSSRMKVESQSKSNPPDTKNQSPGRLGSNNPRGSYESGSSVSFGGKPGFEPLYRRPR